MMQISQENVHAICQNHYDDWKLPGQSILIDALGHSNVFIDVIDTFYW